MPELPDIVLYLEALESRIGGQTLERIRLKSPFLVRSVEPPIQDAEGRRVMSLRRRGKRIVIGLSDDLFLVLHLMIAARLYWRNSGSGGGGPSGGSEGGVLKRKVDLAAFDFPTGTLVLTEASAKDS